MKNLLGLRKPTWPNQLTRAREILLEKGRNALRNPHALTGKLCGCRNCFCCAALQVINEAEQCDSIHASFIGQAVWAARGSMRTAALEWRKQGRNAKVWLQIAKSYRDKANALPEQLG